MKKSSSCIQTHFLHRTIDSSSWLKRNKIKSKSRAFQWAFKLQNRSIFIGVTLEFSNWNLSQKLSFRLFRFLGVFRIKGKKYCVAFVLNLDYGKRRRFLALKHEKILAVYNGISLLKFDNVKMKSLVHYSLALELFSGYNTDRFVGKLPFL